jgi:alkanesulfonate monooxygenase SsuD/methylene tetrahydromethanopterin reductase-like flavin-dependent oxidoreductase (luciferase family)
MKIYNFDLLAYPQVQAQLYTDKSFSYFREENKQQLDFPLLSWEELEKMGYVIAGSPETVAGQVKEPMKQVDADSFMGMFHIGNLPHKKVLASLDLFHKEVMPQL